MTRDILTAKEEDHGIKTIDQGIKMLFRFCFVLLISGFYVFIFFFFALVN